MGLEKTPVFRRAIIPWYDVTPVCLVLIGVMAAVFLFALVGIAVSYEDGIAKTVIWVPVLLSVLSAVVMGSISIRLFRRHLRRLTE
jgi:hypothetical protein